MVRTGWQILLCILSICLGPSKEEFKQVYAEAVRTSGVKIKLPYPAIRGMENTQMQRKLTKQDIGKVILFEGFDGRKYRAIVEQVRKGIITISYGINYSLPNVIAYLDAYNDRDRIHYN